MAYRYDARLLEALAALGVRPSDETPPDRVRAFVNDLYRYELRRLRDRLVSREIGKTGYSDKVIEVRRRYWMLSVPLQLWTTPGA